jgi:hypothetical protein
MVLGAVALACGGDDNKKTPDARPVEPDAAGPDGRPADAQPADAQPADAQPADAQPPTGPAAVWFHGDPAQNNVFQVGRYLHGDPVPVTEPAVIPAAATIGEQLGKLGNGELGPYDVNADGTQIAFAADIETTGRWDLYVADTDGGNVTRVAALPAVGRLVDAVRFSPDGSRIAFRADYDVAGQSDVYVAAAGGVDVTPRRVSPGRDPGAADSTVLDALDFWWTPDSTRVLVAGEFTEVAYRELWSADAAAATGCTAVATKDTPPVSTADCTVIVRRIDIGANAGPNGVTNAVYTAPNGRHVFRGRLENDNRYKLYIVDADGANQEVLPNSAILRADDTPAEIGATGVSADGTRLAFAVDSILLNAYEIHVMPIDGSAESTRITSGQVFTGRNPPADKPLWWSPDAAYVAFVADYEVSNKNEPFVARVGGAGVEVRRLAIIGDAAGTTQDANELAWLPDSSTLYMVADQTTLNEFEVFRLDATMTDQTPELVIDVVTGGDVRGVRVTQSPVVQ